MLYLRVGSSCPLHIANQWGEVETEDADFRDEWIHGSVVGWVGLCGTSEQRDDEADTG